MNRLIIPLLFISFNGIAQIQFQSVSWDDAMEIARKEDKLVFVNTYTDWCEPCKVIEDYAYTDLEVGNFYNKNFINVRLDMEEYPGLEIGEKYEIGVYPTMLFINKEGQLIHRGCGSMDAAELLQLGTDAMSDSIHLQSYISRFETGDRSVDFMIDYLDLLTSICVDAERFAASYLQTVKVEELSDETPWAVFASYQWDIFSREFQYLVSNKSIFEEQVGVEPVHSKLYDTYLAQYQEVFASEELHDFGMRALMNSLKQVTFQGSDTLSLMMKVHYTEYMEDWESYAEEVIELVGMTGISNSEELSELAWKFYLYIENRNQLEIASSWAKQAVDQLPEPSIIDTYASLQYKLGNKKQAIELEKQALELARELYEDLSHYEYQLEKFQRN